jgi:plasmid stabilization system protein ParE
MRLRLGLLRDTAAIEKQVAKEAEAKAKKQKLEAPTVKTEAQTKADKAAAAKEIGKSANDSRPAPVPKARIRPLRSQSHRLWCHFHQRDLPVRSWR